MQAVLLERDTCSRILLALTSTQSSDRRGFFSPNRHDVVSGSKTLAVLPLYIRIQVLASSLRATMTTTEQVKTLLEALIEQGVIDDSGLRVANGTASNFSRAASS